MHLMTKNTWKTTGRAPSAIVPSDAIGLYNDKRVLALGPAKETTLQKEGSAGSAGSAVIPRRALNGGRW